MQVERQGKKSAKFRCWGEFSRCEWSIRGNSRLNLGDGENLADAGGGSGEKVG
jgi:hypothetical protein